MPISIIYYLRIDFYMFKLLSSIDIIIICACLTYNSHDNFLCTFKLLYCIDIIIIYLCTNLKNRNKNRQNYK